MFRKLLTRVGAALPTGHTLPRAVWAQRHRWMLRVLWAHVGVLLAWSAASGSGRRILQTGIEVAVVGSFTLLATSERLSRRLRGIAVCIGLLTCSVAVVQLMDGAIEGHFHFFVMVTLLALYEEWIPYLLSFAYVLAHHAIFGSLMPASVFSHHAAQIHPLKWAAVHALFILGLGAVQVASWGLNEDARRRIAESDGRFSSAFGDAPTAMAFVGPDGLLRRVNRSFCEQTGFAAEEIVGRPIAELIVEDDRDGSVLPSLGGGKAERRYRCKGGGVGWGLWHHSTLRDARGEVTAYISHCVDVTDRKHAEAELAWQAQHDPLTGLASRGLLMSRLEEACAVRDGRDGWVGVLFLDLDDFKLVNDSLGHDVGDRLLLAIAERLREAVRPQDLIARFGGDEFVILMEGMSGEHEAFALARRLTDTLRRPVSLSGESQYVSVSMGVRVSGVDDLDDDPQSLLRDADAAMYQAKERGKGRFVVFDDSIRQTVLERRQIEHGLREALDAGELHLVYQPLVDLSDERVVGVEALLRWDHPRQGIIPPMSFIPLAERNGLIVPIGEWALRAALDQLAAWGDPSLTVSVNVSVRQLVTPGFASSVAAILEASGLPGDRLCLEITESVMIADVGAIARTLADVKRHGVRIAIDDFGVGYASLRHLRTELPVDALKIDRSFVAGIARNPGDATIVEGVLVLGRALGLEVVAEGVETAEQAELLRDWGCRLGQGYHFSAPVDAGQIAAMLTRDPVTALR